MKGSDPAKAKFQDPTRLRPADGGTTARRALNAELSTAEILRILHKWGIHTLGELAPLNKEELRDRLGTDAVRLWERANGTATRLLKLVQPPESFDESFEFDHEIETAEPLLFILRRFLEQLSLRLSSIYLVARELTLRITFSKSEVRAALALDGHFAKESAAKETHIRVFKIPQPTNDIDLLFRMLQTYLENFKSEHPIVAVALSAEPIRPVSQQFGLFEIALHNPQQLYETLARLSALLGSDRVGTPVLEETHRPDAFRMEAFDWRQNDGPSSSHNEGRRAIEVNRPYLKARVALRRFRPPARTSIFISEHQHLESEKVRGQILDQVGPFLLSGNWWDEKAWAQAEWDMQLENGEIVRVHESPPSSEPCAFAKASASQDGATNSAGGVWKLDGIYD